MMIEGRLKEIGIEEPDEEMQEIINLIVKWTDKTEKTYSYYAKYLETDQAEYDFKVDELKEETGDIHTKYLELRNPYMRQYNLYYDIK
jgi:isopropylmalate/homocitrate/citramalate synthase